MIVVYGPDSVLAVSRRGYAHIFVQNDAAHTLTGSGDPSMLLAVLRRGDVFCRGKELFCCVEYQNPLRRKLRKLYKRMGFNPVGTLMRKNIEWEA